MARSIAMINFDSLIVGDKLYIHAGANGKTWAARRHAAPDPPAQAADRDAAGPATRLSRRGFTPDGFSDYTAFNQAGIPIVAFESTNWEIGDLDGYEQTEEYGSFWHTPNDKLATIEELYPERPMVRLRSFTRLDVRVPQAPEPGAGDRAVRRLA